MVLNFPNIATFLRLKGGGEGRSCALAQWIDTLRLQRSLVGDWPRQIRSDSKTTSWKTLSLLNLVSGTARNFCQIRVGHPEASQVLLMGQTLSLKSRHYCPTLHSPSLCLLTPSCRQPSDHSNSSSMLCFGCTGWEEGRGWAHRISAQTAAPVCRALSLRRTRSQLSWPPASRTSQRREIAQGPLPKG